ncbi:peptidoglycan/xylan/chitin deacetylase (PgdA/CDA1 family) [Melghirimyces profundicolus]|uniref:Peptidoglycan/xylan/chitin deacetylase (PgdA/CDA1 family) n=1 Tax=Melghirimyces profundicolus TaxID=1242148 RepID=A0A2T6B786_9BACL|nr:polysaccharide deacetylase family protein [Melghirimyces profundicolus]PTX51927.1 peptidoglycan/xylan/chitin deacetylase (PgdA/CDA1 family) [Melghirimyces profundicolus]
MRETLLRAGLFFVLAVFVFGSSLWNFSYADRVGERVEKREAEKELEMTKASEKQPQSAAAVQEKKEEPTRKTKTTGKLNPAEKQKPTDTTADRPKVEKETKGKRIPSGVVYHGPKKKKRVAITFDDGPDSVHTPAILKILRKEEVSATFFVVGRAVQQHPEMTVRIAAEGHVLANHTWNHAYLPALSGKQIDAELDKTQRAVKRLTGREMALMRPPYGAVKGKEKRIARKGYRIINWDVDSVDWKHGRSHQQVISSVKAQVKPGSIILLHNGGGDRSATVRALPELIRHLKQKGYRFVAVDELMGVPAYIGN